MTNLHKTEFPKTSNSKPISITVERLDTIADKLTIIDSLLIKVDVQGYEDKVLRGGEKTIKRAKVIILETSFEELYKSQPLFNDIYKQLVNWGFTYAGSLEDLRSRKSGRILQEDSIFVKE